MTQLPPTRHARLTAEPLEARDVPSAYDLGDAAAFNALFFADMTAINSDVEGRLAVGGHGSFSSYGIGDRLPPDSTRDDLIVGGDLDYTNGQVFNGSVVHGGTARLKGLGTPNGSVRQETDALPFAAIEQDLTDKALAWGSEAPNGLTTVRYSNLNLRGMHPKLDIFTITPAQLAAAKSICLILPFGATALINVPGDEASILDLGLKLRGADAGHILWNFYEAEQLSVSGVGLKGSVLAPAAHLDFNNGTITGTVAARSMSGNGQFNLAPVNIHIEIQRTVSLAGQVFIDDNGNSSVDPAESGLEGADVVLTGRDSFGRSIRVERLSATNGTFNFGALVSGNYAVRVMPPQRYADSTQDGVPGTVDGIPVGLGGVNRVTAILLGEGDDGIDYLLPLQPNPD